MTARLSLVTVVRFSGGTQITHFLVNRWKFALFNTVITKPALFTSSTRIQTNRIGSTSKKSNNRRFCIYKMSDVAALDVVCQHFQLSRDAEMAQMRNTILPFFKVMGNVKGMSIHPILHEFTHSCHIMLFHVYIGIHVFIICGTQKRCSWARCVHYPFM